MGFIKEFMKSLLSSEGNNAQNNFGSYYSLYDNPIVKKHYENIEKIEPMYSVIYNLKSFGSPEAIQLISICEKDILIAEEFIQAHKSVGADVPPSYASFKRLAMIYEKRKEYDKAINICVKAIKVGFIEDGTKGKMYGRLARMIRLSGKNISVESLLNS